MIIVFSFFSCLLGTTNQGSDHDVQSIQDTGDVGSDSSILDSAVEQADSATVTPEEPSSCADGMVLIQDQFCIDRYEASIEDLVNGVWEAHSPYHTPSGGDFRAISKPDVAPQAHISGDLAEIACQNSGKRLCSADEWLLACQGEEQRVFPYGMSYQSGACNDVYADGHPLIHYFGTSDGIWDSAHMNNPNINQQPNSLAHTGEFTACVSPEGVYDLHGNIHEWVADSSGVFRGGFYGDASINGTGCQYRTTAHNRSYYDYSTGFRCCAERLDH